MLHIRAVLEKDASENVAKVYEDIKQTLQIHFVPLVFQYIAGFEDYFLYAWEKQKANIQSPYYQQTVAYLIQLSHQSIKNMYKESARLHHFISQLPLSQKQSILQTVLQLEQLNGRLLLLTIALREGVKGVIVGQQFFPKTIAGFQDEIFDQFINQKIMQHNMQAQEKDIVQANSMLAPLTGSSSLIVNQYPAFFAHIAEEMENLVRKESYLRERVIMEQQTLLKTLHMPFPLGCTYAEIAAFAAQKPYFSELLYVLSETFPTKFPRLLFTTSLMRQVLW